MSIGSPDVDLGELDATIRHRVRRTTLYADGVEQALTCWIHFGHDILFTDPIGLARSFCSAHNIDFDGLGVRIVVEESQPPRWTSPLCLAPARWVVVGELTAKSEQSPFTISDSPTNTI